MASRRRRKATAAARIALIFAANVAAVWFLWGLAHKPAQASRDDGERAAANLPARSSRVVRASADETRLASARFTALGAKIRGIVERHKQEASKLSKGRVGQGSMHVAVHLRDPHSGVEFGISAGRALRPASNMKIVTTAAALTLLGPDWEFVTPIEARGALVDGRLEGDLVLRAGGDPLFDPDAEGSIDRLLDAALDELERSGLKRVSGNLVLDEGSFDLPAPAPGWPGPEQRYEEYCALSAGFSANRGCVTVRVSPTSIGASAAIDVAPAGFGLERRFSATTVSGAGNALGFDARVTGLIVRGTIGKSCKPYVGSCPVPDPVELFAGAFRHALDQRGISVEGSTRRERHSAAGSVLARIRTPLTHYLAPIHQESNNAVADQVYLAMANAHHSGAREGAQAATLAALEQLEVSGDGFRQVDGSGLSELNRVNAQQLTALIQAVIGGDERVAKLYRDSLAVAGVSGTLDRRMRKSPAKGRIFAKTGFIDGTSSLSGIARAEDGAEIVFSILVNYEEYGGLNTSVWKPMQDEICEALVRTGR